MYTCRGHWDWQPCLPRIFSVLVVYLILVIFSTFVRAWDSLERSPWIVSSCFLRAFIFSSLGFFMTSHFWRITCVVSHFTSLTLSTISYIYVCMEAILVSISYIWSMATPTSCCRQTLALCIRVFFISRLLLDCSSLYYNDKYSHLRFLWFLVVSRLRQREMVFNCSTCVLYRESYCDSALRAWLRLTARRERHCAQLEWLGHICQQEGSIPSSGFVAAFFPYN